MSNIEGEMVFQSNLQVFGSTCGSQGSYQHDSKECLRVFIKCFVDVTRMPITLSKQISSLSYRSIKHVQGYFKN